MAKNCKELWNEKMVKACETIKELWEKYTNPDSTEEEEQNEFMEYGLVFEINHKDSELYWDWLVSWGGPADGIRFYVNELNKLVSIKYFYHDWFDGHEDYVPVTYYDMLKEIWDTFFSDCVDMEKFNEELIEMQDEYENEEEEEEMNTYWVTDGCCELEIEAESARDAANEYVNGGGWNDETISTHLDIYVRDEEDSDCSEHFVISLHPPVPKCKGYDNTNHKWESPEFLGGLKENPGCWDIGGKIKRVEVCSICGKYRQTITDYNLNGRESVEYMDMDDLSANWIYELDPDSYQVSRMYDE